MKQAFLGQRVKLMGPDVCGTILFISPVSQIDSALEVLIYLDYPMRSQLESEVRRCITEMAALMSCYECAAFPDAETPLLSFQTISDELRDAIVEKITSVLDMARLTAPTPRVVLGTPYGEDGSIVVSYDLESYLYSFSSALPKEKYPYRFRGDLDLAILEFISFYTYGFAESYRIPKKRGLPKKKVAPVLPLPATSKLELPLLPLPALSGLELPLPLPAENLVVPPASSSDFLPLPASADKPLSLPAGGDDDKSLLWTPDPFPLPAPKLVVPKKRRKRLK